MNAYDSDAAFRRAQAAYDAMEPPAPEWEGTIDRECKQTEVEFNMLTKDAFKMIEVARDESLSVESTRYQLKMLPREFISVIIDCPFSGEVDAYTMNGLLVWECPLCGHKSEEAYDDESF